MAFSSGYQRFVRERGRTLRIWIRRCRCTPWVSGQVIVAGEG
jgi:hypothetical protein